MTTATCCDDIYKALHKEILSLTIKPGIMLSENALCARFEVSRTPIRSVLQRLQENGLVEIRPYKGTMVTLLDFDIINQIIYQRVAVESMVLRDFIGRCSPLEVEQVRHIVDLMGAEAESESPSPGRQYELDCTLHEIWFRSMHKMYLWDCIQRAQADYSRFRMLDIVEAHNMPDVLAEHREILKVIEARGYTRIEPLMEQHFYGGIRRLGSKLFTEFSGYFVPQQP